ncbi:hypothetical protein LEP1GSC036_0423 [Leptospira weilii str. 2006001853]|uniref:Uncharacterized protein n=1 Tax=Leptospira weilii str. 2006001853 TaxID=1001589 RepID=A0A828Z1N9_9LEPT|nr:hypothetical protein LEP1GSC036_0423 [Leptospira weilii str. 2006001853]EMN44798.1 hypothetical protein LEP1GSC086_0722 [Leptospira weilii str. LNT 1234]QDK22033.1 hypothetical protein FHG67_04205 [Leptospira weilii]QDK25972.1 hypothetical protein FHG68_04060 [Leptospira weilii]
MFDFAKVRRFSKNKSNQEFQIFIFIFKNYNFINKIIMILFKFVRVAIRLNDRNITFPINRS